MNLSEAYYLGGAERAMAGDTKVWPLYDDYCYVTQQAYGSYTNNRIYMDDIHTSPTAVYRIMFRPGGASLSTTGILFGSYGSSSQQVRLTFSSRTPYLSVNGNVLTGTTFPSSDWTSKDRYWEFGNNYIKDLSDGSYIVSGTPAGDIYDVQKCLNLGYGRVYQAEIWDNGNLVAFLLPVKWYGDVFGVYDTIGHRFYEAERPERLSGYTCSSDEPNWSGDTPSPDQHWYLVPVTDSENNPPAGDDYVFYSPLRSSALSVNLAEYAEDSLVTITNDIPVTATTGGEYRITDETYSGLTKWNLIGGIGGAFRLKGKTGDWYLRTERTTSPDTAREKGVRLGSAEPTYFNSEDGKVYVNFVSQNWCWAFAWEIAFPGTEWEFPTPGAYKCNGYYASYDFASHFYLYRLVRK